MTAGRFIWHELIVPDPTAAIALYGAVLGWGTRDASVPEQPYTLFTADQTPAAGLLPLPAEVMAKGARPGWIGYVGVPDVDAAVAQALRLGGTVHVPPRDIAIGRFAVIADPQGAVLALFAGDMAAPQPMGTPGHAGWNELLATDWPTAFEFYAAMFGWQKADAVDMGPMGIYQTFGLGGPGMGGMMTRPAEIPQPFWQYYFATGDIDAAAVRVTAAGGQLLQGPMEVPGGVWVVNAMDPQGAPFALMGSRG